MSTEFEYMMKTTTGELIMVKKIIKVTKKTEELRSDQNIAFVLLKTPYLYGLNLLTC